MTTRGCEPLAMHAGSAQPHSQRTRSLSKRARRHEQWKLCNHHVRQHLRQTHHAHTKQDLCTNCDVCRSLCCFDSAIKDQTQTQTTNRKAGAGSKPCHAFCHAIKDKHPNSAHTETHVWLSCRVMSCHAISLPSCLAEVEVRADLAVMPVPCVDLLVAVRARRQELGHVRVAQVVQHLSCHVDRKKNETRVSTGAAKPSGDREPSLEETHTVNSSCDCTH